MITLNRFTAENIKIKTVLETDTTLEFGGQRFDLEAVIHHSRGETVQSGHYTAVVKLEEGWMSFDDETATKCAAPTSSATVYVCT